MGEYADMATERDMGHWFQEGCPSTPVYKVKAGDRCSGYGCKGHLVERTNRKTGEKFLGCSEFPKCRR